MIAQRVDPPLWFIVGRTVVIEQSRLVMRSPEKRRPPKRAQSGGDQLKLISASGFVHAAALRARAVVLRTARLTLRLAFFTSGTFSSVALMTTS